MGGGEVVEGQQLLAIADPRPGRPGHVDPDRQDRRWQPQAEWCPRDCRLRVGRPAYAAVASYDDDGVQIISLADPANPTAVGRIGDNQWRTLDGAADVATFEWRATTYAAVAPYNDDGVQIISLAFPASPRAVGSISDNRSCELNGANAIATFKSVSGRAMRSAGRPRPAPSF